MLVPSFLSPCHSDQDSLLRNVVPSTFKMSLPKSINLIKNPSQVISEANLNPENHPGDLLLGINETILTVH